MIPGLNPIEAGLVKFLNMNSDSPEDLTEKKTDSIISKKGLIWVGKERKKVIVGQTGNSAKEKFGAGDLLTGKDCDKRGCLSGEWLAWHGSPDMQFQSGSYPFSCKNSGYNKFYVEES